MEIYQRPSQDFRSEVTITKSRFISTISKATTVEEAREFIQYIRDEMSDASHHVYAFRVGYGNSVTEGMSDDGEPTGTSGPPTLAVLRGSNLGDTVLVTTRYFGGTKLGTGGLVRAYSEAAKLALQGVSTETRAPKSKMGIDLPYHLYEQVKLLILEYEAEIDDEIFASDVTVIFIILREELAKFEAELTELSSGQVEAILLAELDG